MLLVQRCPCNWNPWLARRLSIWPRWYQPFFLSQGACNLGALLEPCVQGHQLMGSSTEDAAAMALYSECCCAVEVALFVACSWLTIVPTRMVHHSEIWGLLLELTL